MGLKPVQQTGNEMKEAFGRVLPETLTFDYSYEAYEALDEVPAEEKPSAKDILLLVNNKRKANARSKASISALEAAADAWTKAHDGKTDGNPYVKPTLDDSLEQFKQMVKVLIANKKSKATAVQMANMNLDTSYTEADV